MCRYLCDECIKEHVDLPGLMILCSENNAEYKKTINDKQNPLDVCEDFRFGFRKKGGE